MTVLAELAGARALAAGSGTCHINVNRNFFDPVTHQWREGRNDEGPSDKTVDVHLSWLRRKLGETAQEPRYLHSVRGVGVRLGSAGP